jgi:NTP pyrophosphatase (non-canonical NTP hydrolase)
MSDYTFSEYQRTSARTAKKPEFTQKELLANFAMGLAGESGEVVDALKKHLFHGKPLDREHIEKELGDTLWYLSMIAELLDMNTGAIARKNVAKLEARFPNGWSEADANARKDEAQL